MIRPRSSHRSSPVASRQKAPRPAEQVLRVLHLQRCTALDLDIESLEVYSVANEIWFSLLSGSGQVECQAKTFSGEIRRIIVKRILITCFFSFCTI